MSSIYDYVLSNGLTAGQMLAELESTVGDIFKIHGLQVGSALAVSQTERSAAGITQSIGQAAGVVTVERA